MAARATGEVRQMSFVAVDQTDDPLISGVIVTARDVTQLVAMEDRLREQNTRLAFEADHDHLTGLLNRVAVTRLVSSALDVRGTDDVVVLFVDLDGFKEVNDLLGHPAGDGLLQAAANRLQACIREVDTLARLGGDEFLCVLPAVANQQMAEELAQRFVDTLNKPFALRDGVANIGTSVGIAMFPAHGNTVDQLIEFADAALYFAKHAGRNVYRVFQLSEKDVG
jgi:diguanylate cyclase (GGDEF)-like protein